MWRCVCVCVAKGGKGAYDIENWAYVCVCVLGQTAVAAAECIRDKRPMPEGLTVILQYL